MPSKRDKELLAKDFEKRDKRLYPLTVEEIAQRNSKIEAAEEKERMKKAKEYLDSLPPNTRKKAGGKVSYKSMGSSVGSKSKSSKSKSSKPKGVGCAKRGYGKAMKG